MSNGQPPVGAALKISHCHTTMTRFSIMSRRLKNLVIICSLLTLVLTVALVYQIFTSKVFVRHQRRSPLAGKEKISRKFHPKPPISNSDTTLQDFKKDLMIAELIPKQPKNSIYKSTITGANKKMLLDFFTRLHPANWDDVAESDEIAFGLKYLLIECSLESKMSCKQIDSLYTAGYAERSESKMVEYAYEDVEQSSRTRKRRFVVKSVARGNRTACSEQYKNLNKCATMDDYRLLKEVFLLATLKHPGLIQMKGYCLRGNQVSKNLREKGITLVTEGGVTLTEAILEMATWSQRVLMALQVSKLLQYLDDTPLGSLRITTLKLSDFVLVRGTLVRLTNLDNLQLGNLSCTDNSDCFFKETNKGFTCINKYCSDMNSATNLYTATDTVLKLVLQKPPGRAEVELVERLQSFNISTRELLSELLKFFRHNPPEGPVILDNPEEANKMISTAHHRLGHLSSEDAGKGKKEVDTHNAVSQFTRYKHKNFISLYDYRCPGSMESWGCVFTVTSLTAAAKLCLRDDYCQAFVAFSNDPEIENLMKVVLKNAVDTKPSEDSKATLFIRHWQEKTLKKDDKTTRHDQGAGGESVPTFAVEACLHQVMKAQVSRRNILEKILMNHLGHKGLREQIWKYLASKQDFRSPVEMVKTLGIGGKFVLNFTDLSQDSEGTAKRIMFISEDGPHAYHKAYAVLYQLDRLLGLYYTPPCVGKRLPSDVVEHHRKNLVWDENFLYLISPDGTLSGILVVPPPKGFSKKVLTLEPLRTMTSEIKSFDRSSRLQLEYVLLLWLGRMEGFSETFAFKSHFIHFNADTAFASLGSDMSGYLNHCQFPRQVYEVLQCFQCHTESQPPSHKVCYLGEEVIRRTRVMFPDETNLLIQSLKEGDLATAMNSAATAAVHIVDACIDSFGRDHVLY